MKFLILIKIIIGFAFAADTPDWDQEYKNLCTYDNKFCRKVKNSDGTFVQPKKEIVALLKELAPVIQSTAKKLNVDPMAIAGSIMAENSLNVGITDDVENLLVKIGVANKGEILGRKFTYGLGQLNFQAAREAENYAAQLENRTPMNDKDLTDAILIPEKSIYLVGAVIKKVQDDYKKQGMDISGQPEILTTLYNLGRSEDKALETKKAGGTPKANYFGFFVKKYSQSLIFLKTPEVAKPPLKREAPISTSASVATKTNDNPTKTKDVIEKKLKLVFTKSMPLYSSPPTCPVGEDYGSTNLQKKYNSMKSFPVTAIADKEKTFTVIAPSVDCETNAWQLIKLSSGEIGWIKKDDLEKNTSKLMVASPKCKSDVDLKCLNKVNEELKNFSLSPQSSIKGGELFAKPFSLNDKASFNHADWTCSNENNQQMGSYSTNSSVGTYPSGSGIYPSGNIGYAGMGMPAAPTIAPIPYVENTDVKIYDGLISVVDNKIQEIESKFNSKMSDPTNPFHGIDLNNTKKSIEDCMEKQKHGLSQCHLDTNVYRELIQSIKTDKTPSVEDLNLIKVNQLLVATGNRFIYTEKQYKDSKNNNMGGGFPNGGFANYSNFGMPGVYGEVKVSDQYALRDGDLEKWSFDDIQNSLKECVASHDEIVNRINTSSKLTSTEKQNMLYSLSYFKTNSLDIGLLVQSETLKRKLDAEKKDDSALKKDTEQKWNQARPFLIQMSKVCLSLNELYQIRPKSLVKSNPIRTFECFFNGLDVLETQNSLMLKNILKESMLTPEGINEIMQQGFLALNPFLMQSLGFGLGNSVMMGMSSSIVPEIESSYCPSKTADMIESIMKNNTCVQKVYIPDRWLLNRLNELGDRVVFKPFADDDRYSFDLEKVKCEQ